MLKLTLIGLLSWQLVGSMSCATATSSKALQLAVQEFNQNLRWKRFHEAAILVAQDKRQEFIQHYLTIENDLFIQNLTVKNVEAKPGSPSNQAVNVLVVAEYYLLPSTIVRRQQITQEWAFQAGSWQMTTTNFHFTTPKNTSPAPNTVKLGALESQQP